MPEKIKLHKTRCTSDEYFIRIQILVFIYFKGRSLQNPWKVRNETLFHWLTKPNLKLNYNDLRKEHSRSRYAKKSGCVAIFQCHKISYTKSMLSFCRLFHVYLFQKSIAALLLWIGIKQLHIFLEKESNFPLIAKGFFQKIVLREQKLLKREENCLFFTLFLLKICDSNQAKFFIVQKLHVSTPIM